MVVVLGLPGGGKRPVCEGFSAREHGAAGAAGCSTYAII